MDMTDKELEKRLAELRIDFGAMCAARECDGCEMRPFARRGICAYAWVWKKMKEEEARTKAAAASAKPATADKMEAVQMPKWCKVGQWVMTEDGSVGEITGVNGKYLSILEPGEDDWCGIIYTRVKPIRFRPYSYEEAKSLLGKVMEFKDKGTPITHSTLICRVSKSEDFDTVSIHSCPLEDWQELGATIGGVPIGVPMIDEEALKGGEK
jgi:hypothetical protein